MININPPTLKQVAINLAKYLNEISIKPSKEDLRTIVYKSHNFLDIDSVPNSKLDVLDKITKNLINALDSMAFDYSQGSGRQTAHHLIAKAYGYKDHNVFCGKQETSPFDEMLSELDMKNQSALFREYNKGYKEDNHNWLDLPIIYIRIPKPNQEIINLINSLDGIKFLSDTEMEKFIQSYEKKHTKWPEKLNTDKDTIIKFVNFRLDSSLKIDIEKRMIQSYKDLKLTLRKQDIEDKLVEKIDIEFHNFLPEFSDYYQLIAPIAYIVENKYLYIPSFDNEGFEFPSTEFWN